MTTPTVASCSETAAQSQLDDGPVTLDRVTQFLTLVIECNIVYLILEFSHIKVGSNINYNPKLISFLFLVPNNNMYKVPSTLPPGSKV